jgi:hypothetical protein
MAMYTSGRFDGYTLDMLCKDIYVLITTQNYSLSQPMKAWIYEEMSAYIHRTFPRHLSDIIYCCIKAGAFWRVDDDDEDETPDQYLDNAVEFFFYLTCNNTINQSQVIMALSDVLDDKFLSIFTLDNIDQWDEIGETISEKCPNVYKNIEKFLNIAQADFNTKPIKSTLEYNMAQIDCYTDLMITKINTMSWTADQLANELVYGQDDDEAGPSHA